MPEGNYSTKTHRQHRAVLIPNPLTSLPSELETISQTHIHEGQQAESLNEELKAPEIIPLEQSKFEQSNKVKVTIHEGQRHDERLANDSNRRESRSENGIITTWADRIFPVLLIGSCLPVVTGLIVRGWIISLRVNSRRVNKPLAPKL